MNWREHLDLASRTARGPFEKLMAFWGEYRQIVATVLRGSLAGFGLLLFSSGDTAPEMDIYCLALNIYFEARGEPEEGRLAVAHVVLNRTTDRRWPRTPCAVIADGWPDAGPLCQFSWYCDGLPDIPRPGTSWRDAKRLAELVYWGRSKDPTGGAFWYHADYVKPWWSKRLRPGPKIGHHIFYHDPEPSAASGAASL